MKKKTIKKPKLWKYLLRVLVPALLIAAVINAVGYYYVNNFVRNITEMSKMDDIDYLQFMIDVQDCYETGNGKINFGMAMKLASDSSGYYEIMNGNEMDFSSRQFGALNHDDEMFLLSYDPEFNNRFYEDTKGSHLGTIENARLTLSEMTMINFISADDDVPSGDLSPLAGLEESLVKLLNGYLGLFVSSDVYIPYSIEDAYIDRDNMEFRPGKVKFENLKTKDMKVIDYTPDDTTGLEHITVLKDDFNYLACPWERNASIDEQYTNLLLNSGLTLSFQRSIYRSYSLFELFPFQICVVWGLITFVCLLIAILIARARYLGYKTVYDVMEYRRETTDSMAHDLKTPLAIISAYSENIREETDPDKLREYAEKMGDTVNSANRLLEGILNFSRSESDSIMIKSEEFYVRSVIEEAVGSRRNFFDAYSINVTIRGEDITIKTDKRLFMQAIENLISNCAEHSENNTEVDILISKRTVEFTNISDHKIENTDELKKPFVKGSESRGVSGTGLGLAIAENDLMRLGYELHLKYVEPKFIATVLLK